MVSGWEVKIKIGGKNPSNKGTKVLFKYEIAWPQNEFTLSGINTL